MPIKKKIKKRLRPKELPEKLFERSIKKGVIKKDDLLQSMYGVTLPQPEGE